MKTTLFTLFIFTASLLFAQKQDEGNITIEVEIAPLGAEPLSINSIRGRYFNNDNTALRLAFFLGGSSTPTTTEIGDITLTSSSSNFDLTLRPGYEYHLDGTDKLSPYIGGEAYLGWSSTGTSSESPFNTNEIMTTITKQNSTTLGLNLLSGADFYFTDKMYIGLELGFGFLFEGPGVSKTKYKNPSDPSLEDTTTKGSSSSLNWGPNYQGTLRLGYCIK